MYGHFSGQTDFSKLLVTGMTAAAGAPNGILAHDRRWFWLRATWAAAYFKKESAA